MPASSPTPQPNRHSRVARAPSPAKSRVYTREATGLLIIAVIILIITLARYWHNIAWSAR